MSPPGRTTRVWLAAILGVSAALRLAWVSQVHRPVELRDPTLYLTLADRIAAGDGYTYGDLPNQGVTAYYPPGYPLVVGVLTGLVRLLPGEASAFHVAIGTNVVLSLATVALVFALGRRLAGERVGLVAAAVVGLWPNLIVHTGVVLTETLYLFLLVALLLVLLASGPVARSPGWRRLVVVGALLGASVLVRPISLVLVPLLPLLWWRSGARTALLRTGAVVAAVALVVLPWTARNAVQMGSPVLISTNMGDNLCIGNNPDADGAYDLAGACFGDLPDMVRPEGEIDRQATTLDRALTYMREHPGRVVALVPSRLYHTVRNDHDGLWAATDWGTVELFSTRTTQLLERVSDGYYLVVAGAAVVGAVLLWRARRPDGDRRWAFVLLTAPVQLVPVLVTFGDPRFKMPIVPVLALAAAYGAVTVWSRARPVGGDGPTPPAVDRAAADADEGDGRPALTVRRSR